MELSIFDATFAGDAELVSKALCAGGSNHPQFGLVINDSLNLASGFRCCNFTHVKRLGNSVAHFLPRKSIFGSELQVWMESVLDDIAPFFVHDAL